MREIRKKRGATVIVFEFLFPDTCTIQLYLSDWGIENIPFSVPLSQFSDLPDPAFFDNGSGSDLFRIAVPNYLPVGLVGFELRCSCLLFNQQTLIGCHGHNKWSGLFALCTCYHRHSSAKFSQLKANTVCLPSINAFNTPGQPFARWHHNR